MSGLLLGAKVAVFRFSVSVLAAFFGLLGKDSRWHNVAACAISPTKDPSAACGGWRPFLRLAAAKLPMFRLDPGRSLPLPAPKWRQLACAVAIQVRYRVQAQLRAAARGVRRARPHAGGEHDG